MLSRKWFSTIALTAALSFMLCAGAFAAAQQLKVNLVVGNDSIMIYAGVADGLKIGDRFTIKRGDTLIGACEVTKVESTYSIAKIIEKYEEIREMDQLISGTGALASTPKAAGGEKSKPKETTTAAPKAEPKKEEKKAAAPAKKEEKKAAAPAKKAEPAKKADTAKKSEPAKAEDTKAAAPAAPAPKQKKSLLYTTYPSVTGPTGLIQMMTAEIADNKTGGIAVYRTSWSGSANGASTGMTATQTYSYNEGVTRTRTDFALTYGIDQKFELSIAQADVKFSANLMYSDYFSGARAANVSGSLKQTAISIKYNPRKRVLLQPTTTKKFQTAVGIQRRNYNQGISDNTIFYGAATLPTKKFKVHGTLYMVSGNDVGGRHWGTMAGLEAPLTTRAAIVSDADIFQGFETYAVALRYYIDPNATLSLGFMDITNNPSTMINAGYKF